MTDAAGLALFRRLDRAFWLIWLAFPVVLGLHVADIGSAGARIADACSADIPSLAGFSTTGRVAFWSVVAVEFAVYAALLALAHGVIRRCARGRVLVAEMIGALQAIALIVALWPVAEFALANLSLAVFAATGDVPGFAPHLALDVTVLGMGLLLLALTAAMRQAVALREDADLTI
jgi:hypothetical protein